MKGFRTLAHSALALAVALPQPSFARMPGAPDLEAPQTWTATPADVQHVVKVSEEMIDRMHGETPAYDHDEVRRRIEAGMLTMPKKAHRPGVMANNAETMMQLWILAFAHSVYEQHHMQPVSGQQVSVFESMGVTADQLANGFETYASMLAALGTTFALQKPLDALRHALAATGSRQIFQTLTHSGATSFVSFVGWTAGETLWQEAIYQLPTEEIAIAKDLRFADVMFKTNKYNKVSMEQNRVFCKIIGNALKIMTFVQPTATRGWIYNTWRLKVATGSFITTLTSMVSFGVLAGSIAPGEGNFIGLCFGFVGGLIGGAVSMILPDEWNDAITDSVRAKRVVNGYNNLERNLGLLARYQDYCKKQGNITETKGFEGFLQYRANYRNDIATALIEQIYESYIKVQEADVVLGLVKSKTPINFVKGAAFDAFVNPENLEPTKPLQTIPQDMQEIGAAFLKQKTDNTARIKFFFDQLLELQRREALALARFAYDESNEFPTAAKRAAMSAIMDQQTLHRSLRGVYVGLLPEKIADFAEMKDWKQEEMGALQSGSQVLLNVFYLRAFDEADLH